MEKRTGIYDEKTNTTVYRVPLEVNEAILGNSEDDGYTIYIDEDLTDEEARKAFDHALGHVERQDFEKADVQQIEAEAHAAAAVPDPEDAAPQPAVPEKKPMLKPKKEKRIFTQHDLDLLKRDPTIADILGIPRNEIPKRPTVKGRTKKDEEEFLARIGMHKRKKQSDYY